MTFNQLVNIIEVVRYSSISKGARVLQMSQSHLSASISSLEEELGIKIFHRSKTGVSLTEEGERFVGHAQDILSNYSSIQNLKGTTKTKKFTVSAPYLSFCTDAFAGLCSKYQHEDNIKFSLQCNMNEKAIASLQTGDFDLAVIMSSLSQRLEIEETCDNKKVKLDKLGSLPNSIYMRKGHPFLQTYDPSKPFSFEGLGTYPYVDYVQRQGGYAMLSIALKELNEMDIIRPKNVILVSDIVQKDEVIISTDAYSMGVVRSESRKHKGIFAITLPEHRFDIYLATYGIKSRDTIVEEYKSLMLEQLRQGEDFREV